MKVIGEDDDDSDVSGSVRHVKPLPVTLVHALQSSQSSDSESVDPKTPVPSKGSKHVHPAMLELMQDGEFHFGTVSAANSDSQDRNRATSGLGEKVASCTGTIQL